MGNLILSRTIPSNLKNRYTNLGWSPSLESSDGKTTVTKTVVVPYSNDAEIRINGTRPYLVARGQIQRPLGKFNDMPLQRAVRFDNVGNVKLNMNQALSIVESMWSLYHMGQLPLIRTTRGGREYALTVFGNFDDNNQLGDYQKYLMSAIGGIEYAEEDLCLRWVDGCATPTGTADFWFDVRNGVFFSFDRMFMQHIEHHLRVSFATLRGYLSGG